ncbi:hypothetical protein HFD88_000394 [Aspergillus terreus]|nr:hypothetical protein HFD88_000394 [Aspergillus terreus]
MMRPRDPRVRQRINQISHNLESANETAQEGLYTFSQNYVVPCFSSIGNCLYACTSPCLPTREDHYRRRRRGRAEAVFDFYDDWDNDDSDSGILGWGTGELDRLLAGSGLARGSAEQPRRQRKMSYGTRRTRRKSSVLAPDDRNDPTIIPSSSFLGFLERFPWRFGARGIKYRPSAADLQEHPAGIQRHSYENEPLMEEPEEIEGPSSNGNGRYRSSTQSSRETANSLSSRGDLIPSDEEEDAVPLDDEFAMALGSRRDTGLLESEAPLGDKPASMRSTSGTFSLASKDSGKKKKKKQSRLRSPRNSKVEVTEDISTPSMMDLQKEEARVEHEEESEIIRKRLAARQLASSRGFNQSNDPPTPFSLPSRSPTVSSEIVDHESAAGTPKEPIGESDVSLEPTNNSSPRSSDDHSQTEPFPPFPTTPPPVVEYENQGGTWTSGHQSDPSAPAKDE